MRVLRKNPEPRPGMPGADTSAQGRREAQRRCGPRPGPSATMPVHATAARAGWVPSSGNIKARSWSLALPTMIAVIEIQILDPQLQTLTDPHARSIQKLGEQTMLAFQKTEDANHFIRGQHHRQAPRRPRSSDLLKPADPCTAPCRRRTARPPMPDDAWRPEPCARSPARTEMPHDFAAAQGCRVTHTVETDEGTNPVDIKPVRLVSCNASSVCAPRNWSRNLDRTQRW